MIDISVTQDLYYRMQKFYYCLLKCLFVPFLLAYSSYTLSPYSPFSPLLSSLMASFYSFYCFYDATLFSMVLQYFTVSTGQFICAKAQHETLNSSGLFLLSVWSKENHLHFGALSMTKCTGCPVSKAYVSHSALFQWKFPLC